MLPAGFPAALNYKTIAKQARLMTNILESPGACCFFIITSVGY